VGLKGEQERGDWVKLRNGKSKIHIAYQLLLKSKGKVIPLQAWCAPEGG